MEPKQKIDLNKEVRNMSIIFLVLGVLHFILSGFLDPTWGIILIAVGIIAYFYRSRNMLLVLGIMLILVGVLNMSSFLFYPDEVSGGWGIFAIIQLVWGIQEINKFRKVKEDPKYKVKETKKKGFVWYGLRVGFWSMVGIWIISIFENSENITSIDFIFLALIIFTFILSIIHLAKHKNKAFAIFSLVFSSLGVLLILIGVGIGLGGEVIPEEDMPCYNFCLLQESTSTYYFGYEYYDENGQVQSTRDLEIKICECYDLNDEIVTSSLFTDEGILINDENIDEFIEPISIPGELDPGFVMYHEFTDTIYKELKFHVESTGPVNLIFMKSEGDYNRLLGGENYDYYTGCLFEDVVDGDISCYVSSGGIAVENEGYSKVSYSLTPTE